LLETPTDTLYPSAVDTEVAVACTGGGSDMDQPLFREQHESQVVHESENETTGFGMQHIAGIGCDQCPWLGPYRGLQPFPGAFRGVAEGERCNVMFVVGKAGYTVRTCGTGFKGRLPVPN
jgi:hypothetical protein